MSCVESFTLPFGYPFSSNISSSKQWTVSSSIKSIISTGSVSPSKSEENGSLSYVQNTMDCSFKVMISGTKNTASNLAQRPPSSMTSVQSVKFPNLNFTYGSYLPKVSPSFRKVASSIIILHMVLSSSFSIGGFGQQSTHLNSVENFTRPATFFFSSKISRSCLARPSLSQRSFSSIGLMEPKKSELVKSFSMVSSSKVYPFSIHLLTLVSSNFSFHFAYLPALYLTVVSKDPLPYLNLT